MYVLLYESCAASALVTQVRALVGAKKKKKKSVDEPEVPSGSGWQVPPTLHRIGCGLAQIRLGALMRHRRGREKGEREDREGEKMFFFPYCIYFAINCSTGPLYSQFDGQDR